MTLQPRLAGGGKDGPAGADRTANPLQKRRLTRYHRGEVTILNRAAMEAASCGCYKADLRVYETLLAEA